MKKRDDEQRRWAESSPEGPQGHAVAVWGGLGAGYGDRRGMRHWRNSWGADERKKAQQQVGCSVPPPMDGQLASVQKETQVSGQVSSRSVQFTN